MLYFLELFIIAYAVWVCRRIVRRDVVRSLLGLGILLVAFLLSAIAFTLFDPLAALLFSNFSLRLGMPALGSAVAFLATGHHLMKHIKEDDAPACVWVKRKVTLPAWTSHIGKAGMISLFLLFLLFLLMIPVYAASPKPEYRTAIGQHSLFLHLLLPDMPHGPTQEEPYRPAHAPGPASTPTSATIEETQAKQARFLDGLRRGWNSARNAVAEKTGAKDLMVQMQALQEIVTLTQEEYAFLLDTNPPLKTIMDHPSMKTILEDERLIALLDDVGKGSMTAVYQIGDEPAVQAFFNDPEILRCVRQIDLLALRAQIRAHKNKKRTPFAIAWEQTRMTSTLALDTTLAQTSGWTPAPSMDTLTWPTETQIGVARAGFSFDAPPARPLRIEFQTSAQLTVLLNGTPVSLETNDSTQVLLHKPNAGQCEIVLLLVPPPGKEEPHCRIQAFIE